MRRATCPLRPDSAVVWWAWLNGDSWSLLTLLDEAEAWRLARYTHEARRESFVLGVVLAKLLVAEYTSFNPTDVRFDRTCPRCQKPHAKPSLSSGSLEISVSRSGNLVAVALCSEPVGLDVEWLDRGLVALSRAGTILRDDELSRFLRVPMCDRPRALLTSWTRKEAAVKAVGIGLELDPREVVVSSPRAPARLLSWPEDLPPERVTLVDLALPGGYIGALAVLGSISRVELHDSTRLVSEFANNGGRRQNT